MIDLFQSAFHKLEIKCKGPDWGGEGLGVGRMEEGKGGV